MARRTKSEAAATREALLDAALRVFRERGVARTSLAEVAAAAGVTRGAVYWHFHDKSDLFEAMCRRVQLPMEAMLAEAGEIPQKDPLGTLRTLAVDGLTRLATDARTQAVFEVLFHKCEDAVESAPLAERRHATDSGCLVSVERLLKQAAAAGQLPQEADTAIAARCINALVVGVMHQWTEDPRAYRPRARRTRDGRFPARGNRGATSARCAAQAGATACRGQAGATTCRRARMIARARPPQVTRAPRRAHNRRSPVTFEDPMSTIGKVGVIGAGTMGNGIAQTCAVAGIEVVMVDVAEAAVLHGLAAITTSLDRLQKKEKIAAADRDASLKRIHGTTSYDSLKGCDLVIEAATENEELKGKILKHVDALARPEVILATNTSSISITRLAAVKSRPGKFIGMHFFNPVPMMTLVELVRGLQTEDATVAAVAPVRSSARCRSS